MRLLRVGEEEGQSRRGRNIRDGCSSAKHAHTHARTHARTRTADGGHGRFQQARRPRRRGTALTLSPRVADRHASCLLCRGLTSFICLQLPRCGESCSLSPVSNRALCDCKDMAPQFISSLPTLDRRMTRVTKPTDPDGLVLEAWAQGYMVGSIIIMICITLSNIRRGVLLHKLILLEVSSHRMSIPYFGDARLPSFSSSVAPSMAPSSSTTPQYTAGTYR